MRVSINKVISIVIVMFVFFLATNTTFARDKVKKAKTAIFDVYSEKLEYIPDEQYFEATGNARILIKGQNTRLEADKLIYDKNNNYVIAEDNVRLYKSGKLIKGSYAKFDLNKQTGLIDDPSTVIEQIIINSENATIHTDDVKALKGKVIINNANYNFMMSTGEFFPEEIAAMNAEIKLREPALSTERKYRIKAKQIIIDVKPQLSVITLKNADIYLKERKIAKVPSLQLSTDQDVSFVETGLPAFGGKSETGSFFGPAHVFHLPNSTLKLAPVFAFNADGIGGGGFARFLSKTNKTEAVYTSVKETLLLRGEQKLFGGQTTKIQYTANDYAENGIFGMIKPEYLVEVTDKRELIKDYNTLFTVYTSAGYIKDLDYEINSEEEDVDNVLNTGKDTFRLKVQGNLANIAPLYNYRNGLFTLGAASQYDITVYGTGDTAGVLRAGPTYRSVIGPYTFNGGYFQSAVYGKSPLLCDDYVQGKRNTYFRHRVKLTNNIVVGHYMNMNLSKDNWEKKLLTENQFFLRYRRNDLIFRVGYDTKRKRSIFGIDMVLANQEGTSEIEFDELKINDINNKK